MWPSPDSGVRVAQISNKIFVYLYIFDGTGLVNGGKLPNVYTQKKDISTSLYFCWYSVIPLSSLMESL